MIRRMRRDSLLRRSHSQLLQGDAIARRALRWSSAAEAYSGAVAREVERLATAIDSRKGAVDAALAKKQTLEAQIGVLFPTQKASAEAALAEAQVELDKTLVRAGVAGTVQQFALRTVTL